MSPADTSNKRKEKKEKKQAASSKGSSQMDEEGADIQSDGRGGGGRGCFLCEWL